jgi:hypothetical protein
MCLLHQTVWSIGDMFAVLLDNGATRWRMATGTLNSLYPNRPSFFSRSVESLTCSGDKPRSFEA